MQTAAALISVKAEARKLVVTETGEVAGQITLTEDFLRGIGPEVMLLVGMLLLIARTAPVLLEDATAAGILMAVRGQGKPPGTGETTVMPETERAGHR